MSENDSIFAKYGTIKLGEVQANQTQIHTMYGCDGGLHAKSIVLVTLADDKIIFAEQQGEWLLGLCDGSCKGSLDPKHGFCADPNKLSFEPTTTP